MNDEMTGRNDADLENRRNPRVPVNFNVEIEGRTPLGKSFRIDARAVKVSCAGATLIADVIVEAGMTLHITTPFGAVFEAVVNGTWLNEEDGEQRLGVKLIHPPTWLSEENL